jgi:hypothetical protein
MPGEDAKTQKVCFAYFASEQGFRIHPGVFAAKFERWKCSDFMKDSQASNFTGKSEWWR